MENKKQNIPLIALAVFSIALLFSIDFHNVNALIGVTAVTAYSDSISEHATGYLSTEQIYCIDYLNGGNTEWNARCINAITGDSYSNITISTSGNTVFSNSDLACFSAYDSCFDTANAGASGFRIAYWNALTSTGAVYTNTTYTNCPATSQASGGGVVYMTISDSGGCPFSGYYSYNPSAVLLGSGARITPIVASVSIGANSIDACYMGGYYYSIRQVQNVVDKFNVATQAITTSASLGNTPAHIICDSVNSRLYVSSTTGNFVKLVDASDLSIDATSGSLTSAATMRLFGGQVFVQTSSTSAATILNPTTLATVGTVSGFSAAPLFLTSAGNSTRFNAQSNGVQFLISGFTDGDVEEPTAEEEFCLQPENVNLLRCRLEDNGALTGSSNLLNQSGTNIVCMIGLLTCTQGEDGNFTPDNPDIQTNGVGYLYTIVALGIFVGILWVASRGQLSEIPTFIWFIGTLAILGAMTAFSYIDPTFLIIGAIAVIALAVAKVKGVFGGQTTFAGEMA